MVLNKTESNPRLVRGQQNSPDDQDSHPLWCQNTKPNSYSADLGIHLTIYNLTIVLTMMLTKVMIMLMQIGDKFYINVFMLLTYFFLFFAGM